jgi:hypothetical protein
MSFIMVLLILLSSLKTELHKVLPQNIKKDKRTKTNIRHVLSRTTRLINVMKCENLLYEFT